MGTRLGTGSGYRDGPFTHIERPDAENKMSREERNRSGTDLWIAVEAFLIQE